MEATQQDASAPAEDAGHRRPARRPWWLLVALIAVVALVLVVIRPGGGGSSNEALPVLPSVAPEPLDNVVSGVYCGGTDVECVKSFEEWRGRPVGIVGSFLPQNTWADIEVPDWWPAIWKGTAYADRLLVTVPMLPNDKSTNLQDGATGSYDSHFTVTAQRLVAAGLGNSWIRLGHELNGDWFRWSARQDPGAYAEYFRHIVTAMRAVPGQSFRFDWNVSVGGDLQMDATTAYPGDGYVDAIGEDVYDQKWKHSGTTAKSRWKYLVEPSGGVTAQGLQFWATFAKAHGKPLSFGEWGLVGKGSPMAKGGEGGDDPAFIDYMHQWFGTHDVAFEVYFNRDPSDGTHKIDGGSFPTAGARYQQLF